MLCRPGWRPPKGRLLLEWQPQSVTYLQHRHQEGCALGAEVVRGEHAAFTEGGPSAKVGRDRPALIQLDGMVRTGRDHHARGFLKRPVELGDDNIAIPRETDRRVPVVPLSLHVMRRCLALTPCATSPGGRCECSTSSAISSSTGGPHYGRRSLSVLTAGAWQKCLRSYVAASISPMSPGRPFPDQRLPTHRPEDSGPRGLAVVEGEAGHGQAAVAVNETQTGVWPSAPLCILVPQLQEPVTLSVGDDPQVAAQVTRADHQ